MPRVRVAAACVCLGVFALMFSGCGKKAEAEPETGGFIVGSDVKTIPDMARDDEIVKVNDSALTRKGFDTLLEEAIKTYRLSHPEAREMDVTVYRQARSRKLVSEFLTKQVLVQEARRRGLQPSPAEVARLEALLAARAKKEGKTLEQYERDAPETVSAQRENIREQALIVALREAEFGDRLKITDEDLQAARDRIKRYNAICEQTNTLVKARGAALCERLKKGEAFIDVAVQESEYEEKEPGVWGEFSPEEIDDPNVRAAAFSLPVGAVSEPFDTESGLVIIKVLERKGIDSPLSTQAATVKLGRIILRLLEFRTMPSDEELRRELERARLESLQKDWIKGLQQKTRIEFPHGTNLWPTAKKRG